MKSFYTILLIVTLSAATFIASAQVTHVVTVSNFQFDPPNVFIEQGDTVLWINSEGFHNVNGTTETFPGNAISFTSGAPSSEFWTYSQVFTEVGTYNYQCDVHPTQMQGSIDVTEVTGVEEFDRISTSLYPNPARNYVQIQGEESLPVNSKLVIYDITGKKVLESVVHSNFRLDVTDLNSGIYFYSFFNDGIKSDTGKLLIE